MLRYQSLNKAPNAWDPESLHLLPRYVSTPLVKDETADLSRGVADEADLCFHDPQEELIFAGREDLGTLLPGGLREDAVAVPGHCQPERRRQLVDAGIAIVERRIDFHHLRLLGKLAAHLGRRLLATVAVNHHHGRRFALRVAHEADAVGGLSIKELGLRQRISLDLGASRALGDEVVAIALDDPRLLLVDPVDAHVAIEDLGRHLDRDGFAKRLSNRQGSELQRQLARRWLEAWAVREHRDIDVVVRQAHPGGREAIDAALMLDDPVAFILPDAPAVTVAGGAAVLEAGGRPGSFERRPRHTLGGVGRAAPGA